MPKFVMPKQCAKYHAKRSCANSHTKFVLVFYTIINWPLCVGFFHVFYHSYNCDKCCLLLFVTVFSTDCHGCAKYCVKIWNNCLFMRNIMTKLARFWFLPNLSCQIPDFLVVIPIRCVENVGSSYKQAQTNWHIQRIACRYYTTTHDTF